MLARQCLGLLSDYSVMEGTEKKNQRSRAWNVVPQAIIWIIWREQNRMKIHGIGKTFNQILKLNFNLFLELA